MRSTAPSGSTFRSNEETPPRVPAGPARRPFSSTRVRLAPRPRNERVSEPMPPFCTNAVELAAVTCGEPEATVVVCRALAISVTPRAICSSGDTTSTGAELEYWSWWTRDPVTTISSSGAVASAASTAMALPPAAAANASMTARRTLMFSLVICAPCAGHVNLALLNLRVPG